MKCVDCNTKFEDKKVEKTFQIDLDGKTVFYKGKVMICPKCGMDYADEGDMLKMAGELDKAIKINS